MTPSLLDIQLPSADTHEIEHGQIANTHGPEPRWILQLKSSPFLNVPPRVVLQDLGFGELLMLMMWGRPEEKCLWDSDQALAKLVVKIGSTSYSEKDTGRGLVASWPLRWQQLARTGKTEGHRTNCSRAIPSGKSREITLHALRGRGWSQLVPIALGCSWLGGGLPAAPRCVAGLGWAAGTAGIKGSWAAFPL